MIEIKYTNGEKEVVDVKIDDDRAFLVEILHDLVRVAEFAGFSAKSFDFMIERYVKYREGCPTYTFKEFLQDEIYDRD